MPISKLGGPRSCVDCRHSVLLVVRCCPGGVSKVCPTPLLVSAVRVSDDVILENGKVQTREKRETRSKTRFHDDEDSQTGT
jgi:hypothetical protein